MVENDPTSKDNPPRYHPAVVVVGRLWKAAAGKRQVLRAKHIKLSHIEKCCLKLQETEADYPPVLYSMNLKKLHEEMSPVGSWWLPESEQTQEAEGAPQLHLYF